ncbi:MAG: hypothetical protein LAT67_06025 [Balneolales bacterium]|nr:hypothetical protein [Balneolales bacterium]
MMKQSGFCAILSMAALFFLFTVACTPQEQQEAESPNDITLHRAMANFPVFDLQGHRGARGLLPENTIPSLLIALEYPITTLEFDVVVSADSLIVLSHEPWFHHHISTTPNGRQIGPADAHTHNMFRMTYSEIVAYDVGKRGHVNFPEQQAMPAVKPLMTEAILAVEEWVEANNRQPVFYNIETKSRPEWYDEFVPQPDVFARLLYNELTELNMLDRVFIQSFDVATLQAMREIDETIPLVLLVENEEGLDWNLERLGFIPEIYSPYFKFVDEELVQRVVGKGMKIVPWTINQKDDMRAIIDTGVHGIITDYPNRAEEVLR